MQQKGLAPILIVLLIALVIGGLIVYQKQTKPVSFQEVTQPSPSPVDEIVNWKTYTDTFFDFKYAFKYPADYKPYFKDGNAFYSSDARFDKVTTAKTKGIEIGSLVYGPGKDDLKKDKQVYIGPNTKIDPAITSKLVLPTGAMAKAYVNTEDVMVAIDFRKGTEDMRLLVWCGGENGNSTSCANVLIPLLSTLKFLDQNTVGNLVPADAQTPAAGICAGVSTDSVVIVIFGLDNVAQPRCMKVSSNQKLEIVNNTDHVIQGNIGQYSINIPINQKQTIDATFGSYLLPGVHFIVGAEIWLQP